MKHFISLKNGFLSILLCSASLWGCINQSIPGSGFPVSISKDLPPFQSVAVFSDINFTYTSNNFRPTPTIKLTIDDNLTPFVNMQVTDGQLQVSLTQPVSSSKRLLEIEGPPLSGVQIFGLSTGTMNTWQSVQPVTISLGSSAKLTIESLEANAATFNIGTRSSLSIQSGAVPTVKLQMNDNAHFDGLNLRSNQVDAILNNHCSAKVNAINVLTATLSDNSFVDYKGNPQIQDNTQDRNSRLRPVGG